MVNYQVGFEFEFYTNLEKFELKNYLEHYLQKGISVFTGAHNDFIPTQETWKLEEDLSGGKGMVELITAPITGQRIFDVLNKVLNFINQHGWTTSDCAIQANISFTDQNLLNRFNKLKFVLELDEEIIFDIFPNRKHNAYCKSIKHIEPISKYFSEVENVIDQNQFKLVDSKYYGVNFEKLKKGYLEFRYMGGKGYEYRYSDIKKLTEYFKETMYESCTKPFDSFNKQELKRIINREKPLLRSYGSYSDFQKNFKDIEISVDLIRTPTFVEVHYSRIREKVFEILSSGGLTEGLINYNSDSNRIELKNCKFENGTYILNNLDIISSTVEQANLTSCELFETIVKDSNLNSCKVYQESEIENSKCLDCYFGVETKIKDSYITGGSYTKMLGIMSNCIFRAGTISRTSFEESKNVEYISYNFFDGHKSVSKTDDKDKGNKTVFGNINFSIK